jgi:molecular chaperone GrpE
MYKEGMSADLLARSATPENASARDGSSAPGGTPEMETAFAQMRESYLRVAADFQNYKNRIARELDDRSDRKCDALVRALLGSLDNFERALGKESAGASGSFYEGVLMIQSQLVQTLKEFGFAPREDLKTPFNPEFHEAVAVKSDPSQPPGIVLQVWERGWLKNGKLFRPSKVLVNQWEESVSSCPQTI